MGTAVNDTALLHLRAMVAARANVDGRTDSLYTGLRYYKFSSPVQYEKTQLLMPGVVVVLQGRKTVKLVNQSLSYDELNCLVLGGETVCHGTVVGASANHPYLAIHLDLPLDILVKSLVTLAEKGDLPEPAQVTENFISPVNSNILEAFIRLLQATEEPIDRRTLAPLFVEEIVVRLLRSQAAVAIRSAAAMTRAGTRIQMAIQFICANFSKPLSVNDMARLCAMSPSHFAHSFREIAGVSPMHYLRDVRLEEARTLMLGAGVRPGDAAARVGFESTAHFTKQFKKRFDATPAEYVRRMLPK